MKKFVFLYCGFNQPSKDMMDAWNKWFASIENNIIDSGNPFGPGIEITRAGTQQLQQDKDAVVGYSIINAEDINEAEKIAKSCPVITSIRVYEAKAM